MGTITGDDLSMDIGQILTDEGHINWDVSLDLFPAITEALRTIVLIRPDANPAQGAITLEVNKLLQSLPAGGIVLSDIFRNLGVSGADAGPGITRVEKSVMDQALPGWQTHTTDARIRNYMYTQETPGLFISYPIPTVALKVEGIWGADPTPILVGTDVICINDTFGPAIKEWALFRMQSMEVEAASISLAMAHQSHFYNLMGTKMKNQITALQMRGDV